MSLVLLFKSMDNNIRTLPDKVLFMARRYRVDNRLLWLAILCCVLFPAPDYGRENLPRSLSEVVQLAKEHEKDVVMSAIAALKDGE